jgi:hypothetical protein
MSQQYGPIDYAKLAEKLREELFRKAYANYNYFMYNGSFKGFWFGRKGDYKPTISNTLVDPDTLWPPIDIFHTSSMTCPADGLVEIVSKYPLDYPELNVYTKLPSLSVVKVGYGLWFAFEHGTEHTGGLTGLFYRWNGSAEELRAYHAAYPYSDRYVDLTNLLPSNYKTAPHLYSVRVHRGFAEFLIDHQLVGIAVSAQSYQTIAGPPYGILVSDVAPSTKMRVVIELASGPGGGAFSLDANAYYLSVYEGEAAPPRVFRLYQTGTSNPLAGLSLSSGSVSSHPIPTFGYAGKTIYFMADTGGTLLIEVLTQTGNWRTYDSVSVSANTLTPYVMSGDAVLARVTYTPSAYPATISEAEVVLV